MIYPGQGDAGASGGTRPYKVRLLGLRALCSDRYRLGFTLGFVLVVAGGIFIGGNVSWICRSLWVAALPILVFSWPSRIQFTSGAQFAGMDRHGLETWLSTHGYRREPRGWAPKLPRLLRFGSQLVRWEPRAIVGPYNELRRLRNMLNGHAA